MTAAQITTRIFSDAANMPSDTRNLTPDELSSLLAFPRVAPSEATFRSSDLLARRGARGWAIVFEAPVPQRQQRRKAWQR